MQKKKITEEAIFYLEKKPISFLGKSQQRLHVMVVGKEWGWVGRGGILDSKWGGIVVSKKTLSGC